MNFKMRAQCTAIFFVSIVLFSNFAPAITYSLEAPQIGANDGPRAYNVKSNNIKKTQMLESKQDSLPSKISNSIVKQNEDKGGFQWGNILGVAFKLLSLPQPGGSSSPIDKADKISQLTNGEFSWTKIVSLGLQLVLSFFGNDNVALDKMDPGSPIEALLTAAIAYFTGSNDMNEVSVMAKQATELWDIVISLLDTLRTSFSQRSFEARAIGSNDLLADVGVASSAMVKSYLKTYGTDDDICLQKYICEANRECADETSESGYLFCQMATYSLGYVLESSSRVPFEIISDAGRMGRVGEDCTTLFKDCKDAYF